MSTENASAPAEGLSQPADSDQQNVTGTETPEQQAEERKFTQAELDEKLQKRLAKERRQADARHQELQREIDALKQPKPAESKTDSEPRRPDFNSYEDFVEARAEWRADQKVTKRLEEFEGKTVKKAETERQAKAQQEFKDRIDDVIKAGQKAFPDFDAVINEAVSDELIPTKGPLYEAIMDSDIGEKLVYHLAKNPKEAERIGALSVYGQLRELGKLEDKLLAKKEPRETMDPIGGRTQVNSGLRDDMSMEAYVKARQKQTKER